MNWQFRKLVKRSCPQGTLSPVAKVLKTLQAKLPTIDREQLVPNALHAIKQRLDQTAAPAHELWLNIKTKRHDQFAALVVDLEGTLDRLGAQELLKRIREAAERARLDIIVNFEHLKHASPDALRALADGEALRAILPYARVRYRKFKAAFEQALEGLSIDGAAPAYEEFQDA
jgi:hypothetical protein